MFNSTQLLKSIISINKAFNICDLIHNKGINSNFNNLFISAFCLYFIPKCLCNSIFKTFLIDIFQVIYLIIGIISFKFLNYSLIKLISKVLISYNRSNSLVELMNSKLPFSYIFLYKLFHMIFIKFVLKVLFQNEIFFISSNDLIKFFSFVFLIYAGRDFNINKFIILFVSSFIFICLEFHIYFSSFFNSFRNSSSSNNSNSHLIKENNNNNESNLITETPSVIKRRRGRPLKNSTIKE